MYVGVIPHIYLTPGNPYCNVFALSKAVGVTFKGNMTKVLKTQDINEWIESTAVFMADNAAKMLRDKGYKYGPDVFKSLSMLFMARVMTATIIEVTHDIPEGITTSAEASKHARAQFNEAKSDIQDVVAMAFTTATAAALGRPVDFYCVVKVVPEPMSKAQN